MPDSSLASNLKKIYETWNIRGAVLLSLSLQIILIVIAPFRKRTGRRPVHLVIWLAYILADAAAIFAVGLIFRTDKNAGGGGGAADDHPVPAGLLAFWAPFLLLHLGGPDTITALALEDNELWLRHCFTLLTQGIPTGYVFFRTLRRNEVWLPTLLLFLAAIIKYLERTCSLLFASTNRFRKSIVREPDPGPKYAKLVGKYDLDTFLSGPLHGAQEQPNTPSTTEEEESYKSNDVLRIVQAAYEYFDTFKALIVDLNLSFKELNFSRESFEKLNGEEALNVLQVELNFMYESLFTKAIVLHSKWGWTFRLLSFISVVAALSIFGFYERTHHVSDSVDIGVTYTLLWGAIGLDLMSFLNAISSDWIVALGKKKEVYETRMEMFIVEVCNCLAPLLRVIVCLRQPKWGSCETNFESKLEFEVLATSPFFRRWSGSILCHSLISYCLQGRPTRIFKFSRPISKILHQADDFLSDKFFSTIHRWRIDKLCLPFSDFVEEIRYVTEEPLPKRLWEFIFNELKEKSLSADTAESAKRIFSARGDWVLEQSGKDFDCDGLMPYILDLEYDESLLLWHIATEILHNTDRIKFDIIDQADERAEARIFSKMLSDYMFYLLTFQSRMMAAVAGLDKLTFQDTCAHAKTFFAEKKLQPHQEEKACRKIRYASLQPIAGGGLSSKSVLFKAGKLADELEILGCHKWKILSNVWVELLSYAATHCRPYDHVQLLGNGGGLISIVWLLMAHFGIGRPFKVQ